MSKPYWKEDQLGRGPKRNSRQRAGKKRWEQIRAAKDGPCRICQGAPPNELHHLCPRSQGGADQNDNLVPLCSECHRRVTAYDKQACAILRQSLSDGEYAYAVHKLGEGRFEARYPVAYVNAMSVPYPGFCRTPERCAGLASCPRDISCID